MKGAAIGPHRRWLRFFHAFHKGLQLPRTRWMPQLAQRLRFNLADALARYLEALSNFFKRVLAAIFESKAHLDHALFPRGQRAQHLARILLQVHADHGLARRYRLAIFNEVAKMRIFLFAD